MDKCLIDYPSQRKRWPLVLIFFLAKFVITTPIYMTYIRYKLHTHTRKKWLLIENQYDWLLLFIIFEKNVMFWHYLGFRLLLSMQINGDVIFLFVFLIFFLSKGWFICTTMTIEKEWMSSSGLVFFLDYLSIRYKYLANFDSVISKQQVLFGFLISSSK